MDFYQLLQQTGRTKLLYAPPFVDPNFINEKVVIKMLCEMVQSGDKALFYGDYDADGGYARTILKETADYLGYTNYELYHYVKRTHMVDPIAVNQAITGGFKYFIVCDAGSGDPELMARLVAHGLKVIILDHHESIYTYRDFPNIGMINTSFDNRIVDDEVVVSAGALTYLICRKWAFAMGMGELRSNASLALASMYADVIDMSSDLARSIYYQATKLSVSEQPKLIQRFLPDNSNFTRRFIEWIMNPKVNALFRSENFDTLNNFLTWTPQSNVSLEALMNKIGEIHAHDSRETSAAADMLEPEVYDNFVIGNLSSVAEDVKIDPAILHHYTGLVANKLAQKYKRTAVVVADTYVNVKGSLRDLYGRNYLDIFRRFSNSNGHNAAFGIHIPYVEFSEFIEYVKMVDKNYAIHDVDNEPIIIDYDTDYPDRELLDTMALYNEFAGVKCPNAFLAKRWKSPPKDAYNNSYEYNYTWGSMVVKSKTRLRVNSKVILKPYRGNGRKGSSTQVRVHEILGG